MTIPFWSSIPAITALICAVCIFAFCEYPRRFQNFMVFTATFDGLFILLEQLFVQKDDCLTDTLRYTVTDESGKSWDILMTKRQLP